MMLLHPFTLYWILWIFFFFCYNLNKNKSENGDQIWNATLKKLQYWTKDNNKNKDYKVHSFLLYRSKYNLCIC